jgi:adenylate cyclase
MPGISNKAKIKIKTIGIITLCWMIFLSMVFVYEFSSYKFRFPEKYETLDPWMEYSILVLASLLAGLIGGSIFVYSISSRAKKRPFYYGIILSAVYFLLIYIFITSTMSIIMNSIDRNLFPFHPEILKITFTQNLFEPFQLRNILVWTSIIVVTQFMLQVNDKFGPGNLWKIFKGKYYTPKEELRVFMFLDLRSSTSIAENLGHQQYYHFLNEFYALISDPIINRYGEIYQYVGDEVVISWTAQQAIKNLNCLYCFFEIKSIIDKNHTIFIEKYGFMPEFKAGIHFGPVTAGEVGIIKRDIVFTGDVLNTTSRIQASCNSLKIDLLVSENTLALFDNIRPFEATFIDKIDLRGKEKKISVFTLKLN